MKTIKNIAILAFLFFFPTGFLSSADVEEIESYELVERLLSLKSPGPPEIFGDLVIFTVPSSFRRVGIAFSNEKSSNTRLFRTLLIPMDPGELLSASDTRHKDSGIAIYIHQIPEGASSIEYRLIINGLWTTDPANQNSRTDSSGITWSVITFPARDIIPSPLKGPPGTLSFNFKAPSGEVVTVAGSFNNWDPFMYELKELIPGHYSITIPVPPGKYQYVFFHRGQRHLDPYNSRRIYTTDRNAASEILVE